MACLESLHGESSLENFTEPRTVRVTEDVYAYLQKQAKETNYTIPGYIKHLIEKKNMAKREKEV